MQLLIGGQPRNFIDIRNFRTEFNLPPQFGVGHFEPKDYTGLGRIDSAGAQLNGLRDSILSAIPDSLPVMELTDFVQQLAQVFRIQLYTINDKVNLKPVEVDFAVAGFSDVCHALVYAQIRAHATRSRPPEFEDIYETWLNEGVRISERAHLYPYGEDVWLVRIVTTAYGRAGLEIEMERGTYYVGDGGLACPAEGFMDKLFAEVAHKIAAAVGEE